MRQGKSWLLALICLVNLFIASDAPAFQVDASRSLSITLDLDENATPATLDFQKAFRVVITNLGKEPLRIWNPYFNPGQSQWTLHFQSPDAAKTRAARQREVHRDALAHVRELESDDGAIIRLKPGQKFYVNNLLSAATHSGDDSGLVWQDLPHPNAPGVFQLSAQFESPPTPEAIKEGIWTGKVQSPQIAVRFQSPNLHTPVQLLWRGFAEAAFEDLKKDRKWINQPDPDNSCTPLHHAARFRHPDVVEWLVANGASVNAEAYNQFTPLYFADRPEIVKALLKAKPDLEAICGEGKTPLQHAAMKVADGHLRKFEQPWIENWKEIVKILREAGAKDDLKTAIYLNEIEAAKRFLKSSPETAKGQEHWSPLRLAASHGRLEICQALLEIPGVDVDEFGPGSGYPIIKDALPYPAIVRLLVDHKADLKTRITWTGGRSGFWPIKDNATLLHYAVGSADPETIKLLIDTGVDIFATAYNKWPDPEEKQTALELASHGAGENFLAIIEHPKFKAAPLAIRKAALNGCLTAISGGVVRSDVDLQKFFTTLTAASADLSNADADAIQNAAAHARLKNERENARAREVISILRAAGAPVDLPSAVMLGDEKLIAELLAKDPKSTSELFLKRDPALHLAVKLDNPKLVSQLLKGGCDVDLQSRAAVTYEPDGTALSAAAFWGRTEIAKLLIAAGANVNAHDAEGWTALHHAARMSNLEIVQLLLENGAKIDAKDDKGKTPLDWSEGNPAVADLFEEFRAKAKK